MKIVLLTSTLEGGGAARVLINMANYWSRAGHEVTLVSFEDGSQEPFYPVDIAVRVVFLDIFGISSSLLASIKNNIHRCISIRKALLAEEPDVAISFIDSANVRVILSMLGSKMPVIVSERIHPAYEIIGTFWNVLRRLTYPFAASLVVQTKAVEQFFDGRGIRDVQIIPNPVVPLPVKGEAPQLSKPNVVAVGRMAAQKNYPMLVRAFVALKDKYPAWNLYVAGKRAPDEVVDSIIREHSLFDRVHFMGQVADVGGILDQADIYVLPSLYEGFPNALCEAMASGVPCISTDCPSGPSDIIEHGENGLLVANSNEGELVGALERLMEDSALRQKLGANARKLKESYSEERIMYLWDQCIEKARGLK